MTQERYQKAAEWAQKRVAMLALLIRGNGDGSYYAHAREEHESMMLLEDIASNLASGWVLVPAEPTKEMAEAASALPALRQQDVPLLKAGWSLSAIMNRQRYLAMIAAARDAGGQTDG